MGAQAFIVHADSVSASEAFSDLVHDAEYDRGHDRYNGTISTCSLGRCVKTFGKYSDKNIKVAQKLIDELDNGEKWVAQYIDLGIKHYEVREVKKTNKEYTAKYKQKFVVREFTQNGEDIVVDKFNTKPSADKLATDLTLKGKDVYVKKQMIKLFGNDTVAEFKLHKKTQKTRPKLKSKEGRTVVPIHSYIFFGWASC